MENFRWSANIPAALRQGHDQLRAELVRAADESGRIASAAKRVAALCLPHFEHEEVAVFPIFGVLDDLMVGDVRPEMVEILPMISAFRARQEAMEGHHQKIASAVSDLMHAAQSAKSTEFAELAYGLRIHERLEDELIYPSAILIGKYVSERLGMH